MKKFNFYIIIGTLLLFIFWFSISKIINNQIIIPSIDKAFLELARLLTLKNTYYVLLLTMIRLISTTIITFIIALIFSLVAYFYKELDNVFKPMMVLMKTTPVVAIIVILLIVFGNRNSPYIITAFVLLPTMYESFLNGFQNINQNLIDEITLLTKKRFRLVFSIYIPLTIPYILTTLTQSIGLGLRVMVMSEFIAQPKNTIGYKLMQANLTMNMANIFAWTFILIAFVIIIEIFIKRVKLEYTK